MKRIQAAYDDLTQMGKLLLINRVEPCTAAEAEEFDRLTQDGKPLPEGVTYDFYTRTYTKTTGYKQDLDASQQQLLMTYRLYQKMEETAKAAKTMKIMLAFSLALSVLGILTAVILKLI
ncbi:MAG: hypothetical protein IK127_02965 [Clostridia bacterium]|nr:hypothetical protein [Clostridia bacterium]